MKPTASAAGMPETLQRPSRRVWSGVAAALFPIRCLCCGSFFRPPQQQCPDEDDAAARFAAATSQCFCPACLSTFSALAPPWCMRCGRMFQSREGVSHLCSRCLAAVRDFRTARAAGVHAGVLMTAVHALKYRGKLQLARPLGLFLFQTFQSLWTESDIELILPVPLHPRKMRQRGFNQAYLLIRYWPVFAHAAGRKPPPPVRRDLLLRDRWTEPQTGLGRRARRDNIRNAFRAVRQDAVDGRNILLVDDVYTTGATAAECAKTLRRAGAAAVDILTLARAV